MKKNFLFGVITFFLSLLILMSIYSILIIPYKIYTNSARVTSSQNNNRFDENYGYTLNKNLNSLINLNYINKSYKVISDKNGARISEKNLRDNNDDHKILIIGDSLSFGYGLNYEDTFGYLLEKKLNTKIKNLSVPGYSTIQSYKVLKDKINNEELVIYGFIEDHLRRNISSCGPTSGIYCTIVPTARITKDKNVLITEKILVNNFKLNQMYNKRLIERDYFQSKDLIYGFKYIKYSFLKRLGFYNVKYSDREKLIILKYIIGQMLEITEKNNANLLFVNIDISNKKKKIFNKISQMEFKNKVYFFDASPKNNQKISISDLLIKYDGHPNKKGHEYIKSKLEKYIKENSLL